MTFTNPMSVEEARLLLAIQAQSADDEELIDFHNFLFSSGVHQDMDANRDSVVLVIPNLPPEKVVGLWNRIGFQTVYLSSDGLIRQMETPEPVKAPTRLWRVWSGPQHCVVMAGSEDEAIRKYWARSAPAEPNNTTVMAMVKEIIMKDGVETTIYGA